MFSFFKERKLKKELESINLEKQFDLQFSENYQLNPKENSHFAINSYVFSAHSYDKRQSIYFRLTYTNEQVEAIIYYSEGYNKYILEQQIYTNNCPLKISKDEDKWTIAFNGYLKKNNKDNAKFTFSAKFESDKEMIEKNKNIRSNNLFYALRKQKNYQEKIEELQNDKNIAYNQLGRLKGRLILEGQNVNIDVSCVRCHMFGDFDYSLKNNHIDLIIADKETKVDFHVISEYNMPLLEVGNYYKNNGVSNFVDIALYERQLINRGIAPSNLNILLKLDNEKELGLHIKKLDEIECVIQEQYDLIIAFVEVLMEGKKYRGIMECGFNKNRDKWFDGNDISKL